MKLINGRGQLGEAFKKATPRNITIYHTWNIDDKSEKSQRECYEKFKKYVDTHNEKIIFISTSSKKKNSYVKYKRKAERYLEKGFYVRLPFLIGKGLKVLWENDAYGVMEIISIEDAVSEILRSTGNLTVKGVKIPAKTVKKLILFGKNAI